MGVEMVTGRKRTNVVDALGFLVAVAVCAASADDAKAARPALAELGPDRCRGSRRGSRLLPQPP